MKSHRSALIALGGFAVLTAWTHSAPAVETEVNSSSTAQLYTLSSPYGDPTLLRRRYTHTLTLGLYELQGGEKAGDPRLDARVRMRLDADFGQDGVERNPRAETRFIPELEQAPVNLMVGYVEGRDYLGGVLGFRIGRQYVTDTLGWWSFDGALVRITTPAYVAFEAYGGFEQRGGVAALSTDRFERQGVYRGDRFGMEPALHPSFLDDADLAPAYGAAAEAVGLGFLAARVAYRRVETRSVVLTSPFPDRNGDFQTIGERRTSSERLGASARLRERDLGAVGASFVYDLLLTDLTQYDASVDWYASDEVTVGAAYDYYLPSFDGDSIFNWFGHNAQTTATGRLSLRPSRKLDAALTVGARTFQTDGDPARFGDEQADAAPEDPPPSEPTVRSVDALGSLGGRYRFPTTTLGLRMLGEGGATSHRWGGDLSADSLFLNGLLDAKVIVSLYDWRDELRPDRDATSFSYVLGGGMSPTSLFERTRFGVQWEHAVNRLVGQRYRVLATLDLEVLR